MMGVLTLYFMLLSLGSITEAIRTPAVPRMIFTDTNAPRVLLPEHRTPVQILLGDQPDTIIAAGQTHLTFHNFQNPEKVNVRRKVLWKDCTRSVQDCYYNITVVKQKGEDNEVFVCGTHDMGSVCCMMNISEQSPVCIPTEKVQPIKKSIVTFIVMEGEHSALVEYKGGADFYITHSGYYNYVGLQRFGRRLRPRDLNEEHYYAGLVVIRKRDNPSQDKVYTFYKQKNRRNELFSDMWIPFVSQVCMSDIGGPKNTLQFMWTSQINARLFCGDTDSNHYFPELVHVASVHADNWQDTKVYGLFINKWGMSAVCVYTMRDISNTFETSLFKVESSNVPKNRSRMCVENSKRFSSMELWKLKETIEVEDLIWPMHSSGPILVSRHNYTHIHIDSNSEHTVLFLTLNNGAIHKVIQNGNQTFIVDEVRTFADKTHNLSIILHASSKKLYVNFKRELVQLNFANCARYGNTCQDCILSRDPYCGWNKTHCIPKTNATKQDLTGETRDICGSQMAHLPDLGTNKDVVRISVPFRSQFSIPCPLWSRHAQYTWHGPGGSTACSNREERCFLLIDSMSRAQEGAYECVSEEMGYKKIMARYHLKMRSGAAGRQIHPTVWVCLVVVLMTSLFC